jgi:hypothetical protein
MEETSDRRRAIGCSSVQIGRSCELQRSSALKGSIDVSLAKVGVGGSNPLARSKFCYKY